MRIYISSVMVLAVFVMINGCVGVGEKANKQGPEVTAYYKADFKIIKVVKFDKEQNALGKLLDRDLKHEIGQAPEMRKDLTRADRGEVYLIRWAYSGKGTYNDVQVVFEYKFINRASVQSVMNEYHSLARGSYRFMVKNLGSSFIKGGEIEYWKVTVKADGDVVAEKKSMLWDAFESKRKAQTRPKAQKES